MTEGQAAYGVSVRSGTEEKAGEHTVHAGAPAQALTARNDGRAACEGVAWPADVELHGRALGA